MYVPTFILAIMIVKKGKSRSKGQVRIKQEDLKNELECFKADLLLSRILAILETTSLTLEIIDIIVSLIPFRLFRSILANQILLWPV